MSGRYYRALSQMHQQVQARIDTAEHSPQPDMFQVGELKRLKLSIKDKMRRVLEDGREALSQSPLPSGVQRSIERAPLTSDA